MIEIAICVLIVAVGSRTVLSKGCWYYCTKDNKRKILWESEEHRTMRKDISRRYRKNGDSLWIE
jgi:hypothetical protein